ncbi:MAG: SpoIID/LytB domain-containing protein, partial [Bacteroidales bacterium]
MKYEIRYFALIKCFILTFLLINHNSTCQNVYSYCDTVNDNCGTLSFFVYDSKNGYGVPSVIILTNDKDTFNLKTDNGGHLMFNGREGRYDITIYAADYNPLQTYFYIEKGKCLDVKIILEKQNKTFVEYQKYEYPIIEGYVVDNETGKPLSDVKVTIEDENNVVYTDEKGFFTIMPKKFSIISDPDDEVVRNNITFSKNDYKTEKIIDLLIVPDKIKLIIHLHRGEGIIENKKIQHVLDGDMDESENIDSIKYNQEINQNIDFYDVLKDCRATCNIPSTIRVGTNCSGINCTGVTTMSLQYYTESGLDDEWIASWHTESLKAGSIPYRTYGGYYVQHPVSSNYDIASSTSNQVWGSAIYTATKSAAQATTGKILTTSTGTNPVRSEYSAENNYGGSSYNCSNGYAGGSGSYPCYSDNICSGKSPSGHGRGMCQWGSQRWANNGKDYNWIVNHYYIATVNYRVCSNAAPTNLTTTLLGCPDNKVKFSWQNSGTGWYIQVSTNSSFPQTNSYIKWVSGLTTYTGPDGFVLQSNGTTPLGSFASSTTYYWRIYYGNNNYTATKNFTTLNCNPPNVTVTANPSSICKGKSSTLTASGASTYSWSHSLGSGASKTVTPTTTTTYTVTGTGSNGVTKSVTVKVTVNPTPTVTASASPSTICSGASSVLTAGGASTYSWSGGLGTGSSKTVSPTSTTTYAVTGTSTAGCTGTKSVTVTVNPTPTVTASASSSTICSGSSSTLTAGGASTYSWSHSLGSGASKTVTPTTTTTYTVTGTSAEGCTGTKSVTVTVNPIPTVTASASPSTICSGSSSTLTAGGASTYSWSNSLGTGSSKTVSPTSTTTYTVTGTSAEECYNTATVTVNPSPSTPIISQIYENPIILVSSSISGNQWYLNDNPISGATDQTYIVNENGNYFTIVTIDGCS